MPSTGENTIEYRVLLKNGPNLSLAVKSDLTTLPRKLLAIGLITLENAEELGNPMHQEAERADRLVQFIQRSVQNNCQNYYKFVGVLEQDRRYYDDTLNQLQEVYRAFQSE